jgi:hypothetical protein
MSAIPDSTLADSEQRIADLQRQLAERTAERDEALEYQTATSDVLKVISRSTSDVQPVLDTVVETAVRLCGADNASILIREGEVYRYVASTFSAAEPEYWDALRQRTVVPGANGIVGRVLLEGRVVQITDIRDIPHIPHPVLTGQGSFLYYILVFPPCCFRLPTLGSWGLLASRSVDDDVRIVTIINLASISANASIIMLYPAYLMGSQAAIRDISPEIWLIVSAPIFILLLLMIPFTAGTFRYRGEVANQLQWRRNWVAEMLTTLNLAATPITESKRQQLVKDLDQEIQIRFAEHPLLRGLRENPSRPPVDPALVLEHQDLAADSEPGNVVAVQPPDNIERDVLDDINAAKGVLTGGTPYRPHQEQAYTAFLKKVGLDWAVRMNALVDEERRKLVGWDASSCVVRLHRRSVDVSPINHTDEKRTAYELLESAARADRGIVEEFRGLEAKRNGTEARSSDPCVQRFRGRDMGCQDLSNRSSAADRLYHAPALTQAATTSRL